MQTNDRTPTSANKLTLPQQDTDGGRRQRQLQLSLAQTSYNYMRTYPGLSGVPLSADVPSGEEFSPEYNALVARASAEIARNFVTVAGSLVQSALQADSPSGDVAALRSAWQALCDSITSDPLNALYTFVDAVSTKLPSALDRLNNLPFDALRLKGGLEAAVASASKEGPTAFLRDTLFDLLGMVNLRPQPARDRLAPTSLSDYVDLFATLPLPAMLTIPQQPWMQGDDKPCDQDWFFGCLQTAGFNTTNLRGVVIERGKQKQAIVLGELTQSMGITDAILQDVLQRKDVTLQAAAKEGRLYACDYAALAGAQGSEFHGKLRYVPAPIALFYWNPTPPAGYPDHGDANAAGVLQPVAIQFERNRDGKTPAAIFTPNNSRFANASDPLLLKWKLAKYCVNVACGVQHESIAHFAECHLVMDAIVVAAHRQLSDRHPLLKLLAPHLRFTLEINNGALHGLIAPGGVVATNVAPEISSTVALIQTGRSDWRWDDNSPDTLFELRGLTRLPEFPFRDDTLRLWSAIHDFARSYVAAYYQSDDDVSNDAELQGFIAELVSPDHAAFQGMNGLMPQAPKLDDRDYLARIVAQIIYTAGPLHASVNFAQYPLGAYMPSVAGTVYQPPPDAKTPIDDAAQCLHWYPPLDVSLYTLSFEYLLSSIQFDRLGYYDQTPCDPYFSDPAVQGALSTFQTQLAQIEAEIRELNQKRALPYPYQLPSRIPNSVSI
ncbi:MAG: lipoxygenase family protein [Polyangiaceae bacterium]